MQLFKIEKAKEADLPRILEIYARARQFMRETGNGGQWGDSFPPKELLADDIKKERLYVVKEENAIHGVFFFLIGADPTYKKIEQGGWLSDEEYGTLHRVASGGEAHGIFDAIVSFAWQQIRHLRMDTHENNKVMQHVIKKNGFRECGIIYTDDGTQRIAYEKM
nr:N-acetyltransferase [uncultured Marvinbryantia sp.]